MRFGILIMLLISTITNICSLIYTVARDRRCTGEAKKRVKKRRPKAVVRHMDKGDEELLREINKYGGKWK